jgi:hypothetical protein
MVSAYYENKFSLGAKSYSRNHLPYELGPAALAKSFCAFIDILGFSKLIKIAHANGSSRRLLQRLTNALDGSLDSIDKARSDDYFWTHKFFTDNLVIGYLADAIYENREVSLASTIHISATHQLVMALHGFSVRGAITMGDLYIGRDIVFGEPLVRAHELESDKEMPRSPRIVLSPECANLVMKEPTFRQSILRDIDDRLFINYLDWNWLDCYAPTLGYDVLKRHKKFVERGLACFKGNKSTHLKYLWLAQYHNYFCTNTDNEYHYLDDIDKLLIQNVETHPFLAVRY